MGIRSDVGVAMKNELRDKVIEELPDLLKEASRYDTDEGSLFVFSDTKWYMGSDAEIDRLYSILNDHDDSGDYLVVYACHDYPESDTGDAGDWQDNPWEIHKCVSVTLEFEDAPE